MQKRYKPDELPSSIQRTLYVTYGVGRYNEGKIDVFDYQSNGSDGFERVALAAHDVTLTVPRQGGKELRGKVLDLLREEKEEILAENEKRLRVVQDKIDNLLAIDYKPGAGNE